LGRLQRCPFDPAGGIGVLLSLARKHRKLLQNDKNDVSLSQTLGEGDRAKLDRVRGNRAQAVRPYGAGGEAVVGAAATVVLQILAGEGNNPLRRLEAPPPIGANFRKNGAQKDEPLWYDCVWHNPIENQGGSNGV
jgi:hypothetical protein